MLPIGLFGIDNSGLDTAVKLLILVLVVVWLALVYYTYADARRRIADPMLVGCATVFPDPWPGNEHVRAAADAWRLRGMARDRIFSSLTVMRAGRMRGD